MFKKFSKLVAGAVILQLFAGSADGYNKTSDTQATTGNEIFTPEMKTFYDKTLLREAGPNLVHSQFAQKRPLPKNNGKTIEFHRFGVLPKATTALTEGVTPAGTKINISTVTAEVDQYGQWVPLTDRVMTECVDPMLLESVKALGDAAGLTIDTIVRNHMLLTTNYLYASKWDGSTEIPIAGENAERRLLDRTAAFKVETAEMAATQLKTENAQKINGYYVGIVHPHTSYELRRDPEFVEWHKYATPDTLFKGEIGRIGGVRFVESTEAKVEVAKAIADGKNRLTVYETAAASATSVKVTGELTAKSGVSIKCYINGEKNTITAITPATGSGYSTLTVSALPAAVAAGNIVCGEGGAGDGSPVYSTLIFGANAYGRTDLEGAGLKTIVKQLGSGGTEDPLDQRGSAGWKATLTAEVLNSRYIVKVESCSPRYCEQNISEN